MFPRLFRRNPWMAASAIGLFSLLAYVLSRRVREVGIRMAIGATRSRIARLFGAYAATTALRQE